MWVRLGYKCVVHACVLWLFSFNFRLSLLDMYSCTKSVLVCVSMMQIWTIPPLTGNLISRHREIFSRNPLFVGIRLPEPRELESIDRRYPQLSPVSLDIIKVWMRRRVGREAILEQMCLP